MLEMPLEQITEDMLTQFLASGTTEGRDLEFKQQLPEQNADANKTFLHNVTSLANAQGGHLIYGIVDGKGDPSSLAGFEQTDSDAQILRLENLIRDHADPRLQGVRMSWLTLASGRSALVIRVPASIAAPHRAKNSGRFYNRNSRGKYEMDTHELRNAFLDAGQLPERFKALHRSAIEAAHGTDMPFSVGPGPIAVVTTAPLSFFRQERDIAVDSSNALAPPQDMGFSALTTLEGLLLFHSDGGMRPTSYALTHRAGRTDTTWTIGGIWRVKDVDHQMVWPGRFELGLIDAAGSTANKLMPLGVEGPWVVLASVSGIREWKLATGNNYASKPAYRDAATLGHLVLERLNADTLKPICQAFWRTFGVERPTDFIPRV